MKELHELRAFSNDPAIKQKYLDRLQAHYDADEIIKGKYWENGKGCAVGCTIHSGRHLEYQKGELQLPLWFARLEDNLFEGMPNENAKEFPLKIIQAIPVGANLELTKAKWFHWLLVDEQYGVIRLAQTDKARISVQDVADLYEDIIKGKEVKKEQWTAAAAANAATAATVAADAAYAAATAAAYDADATAAAYATAYAAYDADAAYAAASAACAAANTDAERELFYYIQSEKLIELIKNA